MPPILGWSYATEKAGSEPILIFGSRPQVEVEANLYLSSKTLLIMLSIIHTRYRLLKT